MHVHKAAEHVHKAAEHVQDAGVLPEGWTSSVTPQLRRHPGGRCAPEAEFMLRGLPCRFSCETLRWLPLAQWER